MGYVAANDTVNHEFRSILQLITPQDATSKDPRNINCTTVTVTLEAIFPIHDVTRSICNSCTLSVVICIPEGKARGNTYNYTKVQITTRRVQTHTPTEAHGTADCTMIQLANVYQTVWAISNC